MAQFDGATEQSTPLFHLSILPLLVEEKLTDFLRYVRSP